MNDDLLNAYYNILKPYTNKQIRDAGYRAMEECEFFPRPAQLLKYIPKTKKMHRHDQDLRERYTCPICKNYVGLLIDGNCWECKNDVFLSEGRMDNIGKIESHEAR